METRFQTSFIPKKPVIDMPGAPASRPASRNIFSTIASVLFTITILATGGAYFYKNILKNQIIEADKELNAARSAFETDKIQDLVDASQRFIIVKDLLERHVVVSEIFILLQTYTVKKIRFSDFIYTNKDNTPTLSMTAEAQSYNAIADQSSVLSKSGFFKSHQFSEFNLGENGTIGMKFSGVLLPELISYKKVVEFNSPTQ